MCGGFFVWVISGGCSLLRDGGERLGGEIVWVGVANRRVLYLYICIYILLVEWMFDF